MEKTILLLDNDIDLVNLYKVALQRQGLSVLSFSNPLLALNHFKKYSKDFLLVLTDLRMPTMTGIEFANRIREIDKEIKIYLISAFFAEDIKSDRDYVSAKISKVIERPILLEDLTRTIKDLVI